MNDHIEYYYNPYDDINNNEEDTEISSINNSNFIYNSLNYILIKLFI